MAVTFNADEVFEMALQMERNGAEFYRTAAAGAVDARRRDLLMGLSEMEVNHEHIFAKMREDLREAGEFSTADPDDETDLYLQAVADKRVFDPIGRIPGTISGKEPLDQLLRTAIGLEKESILFYTGMREMLRGPSGRGKIDAIIREELGHVATLRDELTKL
jgi:rubrerythrin